MYRYAQNHKTPKAFSLGKFLKSLKTLDRKTLIKNLVLLGVALGLFGFLIGLGALAWFSRGLPNPDELLNRDIDQATKNL